MLRDAIPPIVGAILCAVAAVAIGVLTMRPPERDVVLEKTARRPPAERARVEAPAPDPHESFLGNCLGTPTPLDAGP